MNQHDVAEYRRELLHAIHNPGTEFDIAGGQAEIDRVGYWQEVQKCDNELATYPEKI